MHRRTKTGAVRQPCPKKPAKPWAVCELRPKNALLFRRNKNDGKCNFLSRFLNRACTKTTARLQKNIRLQTQTDIFGNDRITSAF